MIAPRELVDDGHLFLLTSREAVACIERFLTAENPLGDPGGAPATVVGSMACAD